MKRDWLFIRPCVYAVAAALFLPSYALAGPGLPGELRGAPPWPANNVLLRERLRAIGLPALSGNERMRRHRYIDVAVYVHGRPVRVPGGVGISRGREYVAPLHKHAGSSTETVALLPFKSRRLTLADFFGVWGVRFTGSCLGGYCSHGAEQLRVFVNGNRLQGDDPRHYWFIGGERVVVTFGDLSELPPLGHRGSA